MKNLLPIQKESLFEETRFIRFCNRDEYNSPKLNTDINETFLACAEKDGLLIPLLITEEAQIIDGKTIQVKKKYYSPFQIFQVLMLYQNKITTNGLAHPNNEEYLKGSQSPIAQKYIKWGEDDIFELFSDNKSIKEVLNNFHSFLSLLHSQVFTGHRYFVNYPKPDINLDFIHKEQSLIGDYGLDEKKLSQLRQIIGYNALHIDPFEKWFYYIKKHTTIQKDWLKGKAIVAQDLYLVCEIVAEILKILTGKEEKLLPDFINPQKLSPNDYTIEYAEGIDILGIKKTLGELKNFVESHTYLSGLGVISKEAKHYLISNLGELITSCNNDIDEFISIYGNDRRHLAGLYEIQEEKEITEDKLDPKTLKIYKQLINPLINNSNNGYVSQEDLVVAVKNKAMSKKDALDVSLERNKRLCIADAIERRMDELRREVSEIANKASGPFRYYQYDLEEKINKIDTQISREPLPQHLQGAQNNGEIIKYWQERKKEAKDLLDNKIETLNAISSAIDGIGSQTWRILCGRCRKNYVLLKHGYQEQALFSNAFCDECIQSGSISSIKHKCSNCGNDIIYYAYENSISSQLLNKATAKITLEYGRMRAEIECKKCGIINTVIITSGFSP